MKWQVWCGGRKNYRKNIWCHRYPKNIQWLIIGKTLKILKGKIKKYVSKLVLGYCLKTKNYPILQARWLMIEEVHMSIFCGSLQLLYILWAKVVIANVLDFLSRMSALKRAWRGESIALGQKKKGSFSSTATCHKRACPLSTGSLPGLLWLVCWGKNSLQISKKAFLKSDSVREVEVSDKGETWLWRV